MCLRRLYRPAEGFTLVEVLVSMAIAGILLASVSLMVRDAGVALSRARRVEPDDQYYGTLDLMAADARGIVQIEPLVNGSGRGDPLARFITTNRINATCDGYWMGSAHIGYWLADRGVEGKVLWRSEVSYGSEEAEKRWICLMEGLENFEIELCVDDGWRSWPESESYLVPIDSGRLRITAMMPANVRGNKHLLPVAVLPIIACVNDKVGQ